MADMVTEEELWLHVHRLCAITTTEQMRRRLGGLLAEGAPHYQLEGTITKESEKGQLT